MAIDNKIKAAIQGRAVCRIWGQRGQKSKYSKFRGQWYEGIEAV